MKDSLINGFLVFGIVQSLFIIIFYLLKQKRTTANVIIISILLLFMIQSLLIIFKLNFINPSPIVKLLPINITLLYGPLFPIYVKTLNGTKSRFSVIDLFHLIPFIIFFASLFLTKNTDDLKRIMGLSGAISGSIYCVYTYYSLRKHKTLISNYFSNDVNISLNWISLLLIGISFIWFSVLVLTLLNQFFKFQISLNWFFILIPFFIAYIGYKGFTQDAIFNKSDKQDDLDDSVSSATSIASNKSLRVAQYRKSGLQPSDLKAVYEELKEIMLKKKLYLNANLSLKELSNIVNIPQHHITQALNTIARHNFYDFVNTYRINHYIDNLKNGKRKNYSLLGLAFDSGFNSKSTFNRIFKKTEGMSPTEYIKSHLNT